MDMSRKTRIKDMRYEDFNDNEYLEKYVEELRRGGTNVVVAKINDIINWGRSNSVWPLTFATSCCGIEFMSMSAARYDFGAFRMGGLPQQSTPADILMVFGDSSA